MPWHKCFRAVPAGLAVLLAVGVVQAAKISDVRNTKHNLSVTGTGTLKAASETQVCVFCHTPHSADISVPSPLWNRKLSSATYATYTSSSIEANAAEMAAAPGGSSKLCLSCHDGTMAIDKVNVLNGAANPTIAMTVGGVATSPAYMPPGSGTTSGYTRNLGINLTNDHPISFTYDSTLAANDGELRTPDGTVVGSRVAGVSPKPKMPLENSQMQCATCHDPHLRDTVDANAKFLRMNRLQTAQPGASFSQSTDIVCLACHDKGGLSWAYSTHANSQVTTQAYTDAAAAQREFPVGTKVWQAACLNCHDTHTVQGARRLLREGTDSLASPKTGGSSALEEACYTCHTTSASAAVTYTAGSSNAIPDIKTDFSLLRHMPIKSTEQMAGTEVHDIGGNFNDSALANCANTPTPTGQCGKDLLESRAKLGVATLTNRHAECSDCHNPHRVVNFRDFRGNPAGSITGAPDGVGTHPHTDTAMNHTNIASGALRGTFGVEPSYGSASFHALPSGYTVKRGDPGTNTDTAASATYVTREYQICLKCHSDYGYSDNNVYPAGNRPPLGSPGTPSGTNGLTIYSNQAKEFQSPTTHQGEPLSLGTDAGSSDPNYNTNNHRSWHPVMNNTGRSLAARNITTNSFLLPWGNNVGSSTMYCSDCHGSNVSSTTSVIPDNGDNGNPWGPHGSGNDFLLKGAWTDATGSNANLLCFKCHQKSAYSGSSNSGRTSGFYGSKGNLHNYHVGRVGELRCTWCHVAVPHGWKNKSLLVNLNDVGAEAGQSGSKEVAINGNADNYTKEPYYYKAKNKIVNFKASGNWSASDCGSAGKTGANLIANSQGGTSNNTNTGGCGMGWMGATCTNPP